MGAEEQEEAVTRTRHYRLNFFDQNEAVGLSE